MPTHVRPEHNSGGSRPTLYEQCVGSFKFVSTEGLWDRAYGLFSLSEKTSKSNHLQTILQRQCFLLSYFRTLSVGPTKVLNLRSSALKSDAQTSSIQPTEMLKHGWYNPHRVSSPESNPEYNGDRLTISR